MCRHLTNPQNGDGVAFALAARRLHAWLQFSSLRHDARCRCKEPQPRSSSKPRDIPPRLFCYIPSAAPAMNTMESPCLICAPLDLRAVFQQGDASLLGRIWTISHLQQEAASCPLCRTILWVLQQEKWNTTKIPNSTQVELQSWKIRDTQCAILLRRIWGTHPREGAQSAQCSHFLLPLASGWSAVVDGFPVTARRVPDNGFDSAYVSSWLSHCDALHGWYCASARPAGSHATNLRLRVIDVGSLCLISSTLSQPLKYAALSYVWGRIDQLTLRQDRIKAWETPGALSSLRMPKTIKDAITVCKQLDIRYLWVDSLCIVQDSLNDVKEQVSNMHTIYSQAYLTIVVSAGRDCEAGIPGVHARAGTQHTSHANGLDIATSFLPIENELSATKWSSRAWTLQEFVLSRRCLVFTARQIFFCCGDGIRREEVNGYLTRNLQRQEISVLPILRPAFISNRSPDEIVTSEYNRLVSYYTARELSLPGDIIKAFSGILGALSPSIGWFSWGLPMKYINYSLMWSFHGSCCRRPGFPSWSWAGWHFDAVTPPEHLPTGAGYERPLPSRLTKLLEGPHFGIWEAGKENRGYTWNSPQKSIVVPTYEPWSNRSVWQKGSKIETLEYETQLWVLNRVPAAMPPAGTRDGETMAKIISFRSSFAQLDLTQHSHFRFNALHRGNNGEGNVKMHFVLIGVAPPDVVILPIAASSIQGLWGLWERIDNPQTLHEELWFKNDPEMYNIHLV
ncbi:heterokaryon incompatibility protein-domain-containing protein [Cercophora newfieldiana]|uniref:Heterokaryon incompatibility protein-domain-containing protein n=1 Tax=Cercophora newfieldiana TaxID=92897 RepID=A0AA39YHR1_9PEZI|nr:heterokaryon incompatibility protein-domain-containing protein [Cercophora newfieldiana]